MMGHNIRLYENLPKLSLNYHLILLLSPLLELFKAYPLDKT